MDASIGVLFICAIITSQAQDVRLPPHIVRQNEKSELFTSYSAALYLTCDAAGVPTPEYKWYVNGHTLTSPFDHNHGSGNISLKSFLPSYEGEYQCFAQSKYGVTMTSKVKVTMATIAGKFPTLDDPVPHFKKKGEWLKVVCNNKPKSVPEATFSWLVVQSSKIESPDTKPIPLSPRVQIDDAGDLVIANLVKSDEFDGWEYRCDMTNNIGGSSAFGSYTRIYVNDTVDVVPRKPKILSYTHNEEGPIIAIKKTLLTLRCFFEGIPEIAVTWRRADGRSLSGSSHEHFNTVLKIDNVDDYDEATYICTGSNTEGNTDQLIRVEVNEIPNFIGDKKPTNVNVTDGMDVEFNCETSAKPPATITWFMNGRELTDANSPARVLISDDRKSLRVTKVCKDCKSGDSDLRVYACEASNKHGTAFSAGYINVLEPTILTEVPVNRELTYVESNITFTCGGSTDDSTPLKVTWWRDAHRVEEVEGELYAQDTAHGSTLYIITGHLANETKLDYIGTYMCVLYNGPTVYSPGYSYVNVTVTLLEDPDNTGKVVGPGVTIGSLWWVFVVAALLMLIILLIICCCCYLNRNRGDMYDVDEKERLNGFDPDQEMANAGYHEYQRPEVKNIMGSRASLSSNMRLDDDGTTSLGQFDINEDGSFIGLYNTVERRQNQTHL